MSNKQEVTVNRNGLGFFGLLTIVLVIAKLAGYFPYSWWWVFSPIIVATVLFLLLLVFIIVVGVWLNE